MPVDTIYRALDYDTRNQKLVIFTFTNYYLQYKFTMIQALTLPGELAVMQKQALECSPQGVQASPDVDQQLKDLIEGQEVLVYVTEVNNSRFANFILRLQVYSYYLFSSLGTNSSCSCRLLVKLYDLQGKGIMDTGESDGTISSVCPMPILSSTHKVFVSYAAILEDHSVGIWLQRCSNYEIETKLSADLQQYYPNSGQILRPEAHLLCAAKCSDDLWYRAKIISCTETTAYVNYIDYGNSEEVALEFIMALAPQFHEFPQLAVNATLSVALVGTDAEQINILQTHMMNKELTAVFYNVHSKWIVDLIESGEKLSDKFRSLNLVREEEEGVPPQPAPQTQEPRATCQTDVYVSHTDSPSQLWLQQTDNSAALNQIQKNLQLEVSNFPTIDGVPEEGTLCVAIYSFDENWYRAEVLDADEDITTVRFIDYGNTDVIDKADHIRQMPDTWKNIERYAFKCKLDVIPAGTEDWSQATCDRFEELVMSDDALQATILTDAVPKRVELFVNGKSVSEILVEEKHAVKVSSEQAELVNEEIVDIELDPHSAFVCHIDSPSEFWVQEEKSVADLEIMTDRFMVADMFPKIEVVEKGLLCVAKYPEDSQWYRARVLSHGDNGTEVIFVDYGNSSVSTEIRALPEDLAGVPLLSRKCCLELPSNVKGWSNEACDKFIELAAEGATIFILEVLKEQETSTVKLTLDNQNVADTLAGLCEQHSPVTEERLPPLGEENSPNVMVSHINSPDEFWIQAESSISELEVMSERLRDAQSFLTLTTFDVGTVCAALYPEDEYWYRAKIVARREEGTEVLYMDYGNSAVTEELRVLPQDIVDIPTLSRRCALEKPQHIAAWSERACDKFKELAAEGATMFQFETLDENDPMHVRLSLNGTNVIELLQTECKDIARAGEAIESEAEDAASARDEQVEVVANEIVQDHSIEETSDFGKAAEKKLTLNQILTPDTNLPCINQIEHKNDLTDNSIDEDVINRSFGDPDVDKQVAKEQQGHMVSYHKITDLSELELAPKRTSEVNKVFEDIGVTDATLPAESAPVVTELSVDDIIGSMVRDATEDSDPREINAVKLLANEPQSVVQDDVNDQEVEFVAPVQSININEPSNLSDANEQQLQSVAQYDADEQQESHSEVQSLNISESVSPVESTVEPTNERISMSTAEENVTEDSDSKEVLSVKNDAQSPDIVQLDVDQIEEEKGAQSEAQPNNVDEPSECEILYTTFDDTNNIQCLPKEDTNCIKEFQEPSPAEDETAHRSAEKDDLKNILKSASTDPSASSRSTDTAIATPLPSVTKIDPFERRRSLSSRRRSEDKIVPGCISRGESPDPEAMMYSLTPKIEKPAASAVNTLQPVADSAKEEDEEILAVSIESNIP